VERTQHFYRCIPFDLKYSQNAAPCLSATSRVVLPNILNILNETEGVVTAPHHQQVRLPVLRWSARL
jgi:hypothetical protein